MPRPREYDDDLRRRLLETAGRLLADEGPHALSTRRIASEVGTSTTAIYSLIGSKEELTRQMFLEGFRRLAAHLDAVPPDDDPLRRLAALGQAYLDNALENPSLYQVMFSRPVPEFHPTEDDITFTLSTLQTNIDAVQACIDAGLFRGNAEDLAVELWAIEHGIVSLAVGGLLDPDRARQLCAHVMAATSAGYAEEARSARSSSPGASDGDDGSSRRPSARQAINVRS
jgi:AcrR family transcriptional regulator